QLQIDQKQLTLLVRNRPVSHDLQGDEKRIRQIIVNLINNAIKYTSNKGVITICSEYRDAQLFMSIEDTGCGIAKENLEQIFTPFVQLNGISFSRDGVGLGLAITKELVNLMKGKLSVTSQIGKGSIFSVSLPLPAYEKIHYAVSLPDYQEIKAANSISILIVDDNEINLLLLTNMLELQGYRVDATTNGQEALALIAKNYYSVALVDLNMPIMSGMELVKAIREQEQHVALRIVAISAYADTHKKIEALVAGFDFYLPKPIDEDQLLSLIQAIHIKTG
ncbi:MAG: ATP-binding protein, partial [Methylococcales bacterium]